MYTVAAVVKEERSSEKMLTFYTILKILISELKHENYCFNYSFPYQLNKNCMRAIENDKTKNHMKRKTGPKNVTEFCFEIN